MIITCESCSTQFQLDSSRIPAQGIRVRCTICKHAFFVENHEAATGDPVDRAVGRALLDDEEGIPDVAHDLGASGQGGRFAQSFAVARSAVDDLLGFGTTVREELGGAEPDADAPAPREEPVRLDAGDPDEIVFDVDEALASEAVADPQPEPQRPDPHPDPFAEAAALATTAPEVDPWSASELLPAPGPGDSLDPALDPDLDPWDTPLPDDAPAPRVEEPAADSTDDADPWDTAPPLDDAPAGPVVAAPSSEVDESPVPLGGRFEAVGGGYDEDDLPIGAEALAAGGGSLEAEGDRLGAEGDALDAEVDAFEAADDAFEAADDSLEAADDSLEDVDHALDAGSEALEAGDDRFELEEEDLAEAIPAAPRTASRAPAEAGEPEDELEEALKLGWGGSTDTAGIELAEARAAAPPSAEASAGLDAGPATADEDWDALDLGDEPAAQRPTAPAASGEAALPAIGVGTRLGAPRRRRALAWLAALGDGSGWAIVAALTAVLLWASLAPRAAHERGDAALALAGLEASGIAGHWVENALVGPVLVVSGELRNAGSEARAPGAPLVVRLLDAHGAPLDAPPTRAGVPLDREQLREASAAELRAAGDMSAAALVHSPLAPGATQRFEAVLLSVPEAAGRFELAAEAPGGGSS